MRRRGKQVDFHTSLYAIRHLFQVIEVLLFVEGDVTMTVLRGLFRCPRLRNGGSSLDVLRILKNTSVKKRCNVLIVSEFGRHTLYTETFTVDLKLLELGNNGFGFILEAIFKFANVTVVQRKEVGGRMCGVETVFQVSESPIDVPFEMIRVGGVGERFIYVSFIFSLQDSFRCDENLGKCRIGNVLINFPFIRILLFL